MKIASKIQLLTVGLVTLTAAVVAPVTWWGFSALISRQQTAALDGLLEVESRRIAAMLVELDHDVAVLEALPALAGLTGRQPDIAAALDPEALETVLAQVFVAMASAKPHYNQIRLIGDADGGRERVRVDNRDGRVQRIPQASLQRKGQRPYYRNAAALPPGQTHISRVELNREHGRIEQPERPTLRASRPVHRADGSLFGVLVINVDFQPMARALLDLEHAPGGRMLANAEGDFLLHPDPSMAFGFDRGERHRVQDAHPALAPMFTVDGPTFVHLDDGDRHVAWRRVPVLDETRRDPLYLGISQPSHLGEEATIANLALLAVAASLVVALAAGLLVSRRLTRPIERLTRIAARIAEAADPALAADLPTARPDEIGTFARAFSAMLDALAERERRLERANVELQRANTDLDHFAYIATHDLREPARRAAGIADILLFDEADRLSAEGVEMLERLQAVSENMLDRIADFRVLSGIGSGALVRRAVPLDPLLDRVLAESADVLEGRPVTMERAPLPTLAVYPELLELCLRNLIGDAVRRAGERPCTLTFGARPPAAGEGADGPVLTMRADGFTVSPEQRDDIFLRVARLGEGADGSGLGLPICRRIAERHAGWIRADFGADHVTFSMSLGGTDERQDSAG